MKSTVNDLDMDGVGTSESLLNLWECTQGLNIINK